MVVVVFCWVCVGLFVEWGFVGLVGVFAGSDGFERERRLG